MSIGIETACIIPIFSGLSVSLKSGRMSISLPVLKNVYLSANSAVFNLPLKSIWRNVFLIYTLLDFFFKNFFFYLPQLTFYSFIVLFFLGV